MPAQGGNPWTSATQGSQASTQNPQLQLTALEKAGCWPIYQEKASGAAGTARPVRDETLRQLNPGDTLAVWKLDRLGRSIIELQQLVTDLERRGVKFRSLTEHIDTSTPEGRLFFVLLAAFAEFERAILIERVRAGKAERAAAGLHPGGNPMFGFEQDHVTQVPHEAALVREAAEHVLSGGKLGRLADAWNSRRVATKNGKGRWNETMLRRVLTNARVAPIVGEPTYQQLQQLFTPASERRRLGAPATHLLSGILVCATCDVAMYPAVENHRAVYRCRRAQGSGGRSAGCGAVSISERAADRWMTEAFIAAICSDNSTHALNARRAALLANDVTAEQVEEWGREAGELEQVLGTRFGTDEHRSRRDELQRLVRRATAQLLQRPELRALLDLPRTEKALQATWTGWDLAMRRRYLKLVLKRVRVKPIGPTHGRFDGNRLDPDWRI